MTANRGLFVRNNGSVGTTPTEGRLVLAELVAETAPGVPRQGLLDQSVTNVVTGTASTSPMSYDIAACTPVINRATNEGVYIMTLTGTTNVTTTAAPGTGSRYDLIYVKQNDTDKGDADNLPVVAVLQGTSAVGTPTKPYASLPAGAYVLAEALVNTGATATNGAQVTITQVWRYTSLRGVPVPVRSTTERDEITPTTGLQVRRLDVTDNPRAIDTWNGTAWFGAVLPFAHIGKTDGFSAAATPQPMTAQLLEGGMTLSSNGIVVPVAGLYHIAGRVYCSGGQLGLALFFVQKNGSNLGIGEQWNKELVDEFKTTTGTVRLAAGDRLTLSIGSPSSVYGTTGYNGTWLEATYVGP